MYNLVSCYDTLELKSRGDVLSDKVRAIITKYQIQTFMLQVYFSEAGEGEMLRISQSESILTDMTHVISPMSFSGKSPMLQQYQAVSKYHGKNTSTLKH